MAHPPGLGADPSPATGPRPDVPGPSALLAHLRQAVAAWDRDLRLRAASPAFLALVGVDPDVAEPVGRTLGDLLGPEADAASRSAVRAALEGCEAQAEWPHADGDGHSRTVRTTYLPDEGGLLSVTDVAGPDPLDLQASVDQYRALARSMPSGFVVLFDRDLRILIADGVELPAFGYSRTGLEGRTVWEGMPEALAAELEPRYRRALAGESVTWERQVGTRTFKLTAGPVRPDNGDIVAGMVTALDITAERRTQRSWAALHAIATSVVRKTDPAEVAWSIAAELVALFEVDTAAVVRFDARSHGEIVAMAPESLARLVSPRVEVDDGSAVARVLATGEPAIMHYAGSDGDQAGALRSAGVAAGAAAPIRTTTGVWGAVALAARDPQLLDRTVLEHLASFAELVGLAVGNSEEWGTLERAASTDELTGLPNRRVFLTHLRAEHERARRHGRPMCVVVMDLDHFKNVNDTWGHPVGDRVLAEFGRRLAENSRGSELVARLGGEEFGWILPETDASVAVVAAERLRSAVSHEPFETVGRLTVSVGIASVADVPEQGPGGSGGSDGTDALMANADQALYAAKRGGRDRVAVHTLATLSVVDGWSQGDSNP